MTMNGTPITIVGNLTDDPELRFTPSGAAVAKFSVAVNRRQFDRQANEWKEAGTDFHRVSVWRDLAEHVAGTLTKGMRVIVVGELRQHSWTDEKTNEKRSAWEVTANSCGPDLTFATATVTKTTRTNGSAPGDDAWSTASRTRPAVPAGAGAPANGQPQGGYSDEPPF
ncbi:single-stranded DNA-binding protein [Streptomyces violascens]|uniref:Single-stranded DNA-binding protein n=1 Tax=Streptomyces violascens TaxID=67381 RepID=A0ABQ3QR31_9ACTN|nr:single-stranded DNA-binding protein [Streptomyces violascens]GGU53186.1 single-stranded DNA-binding protein [Streptomyces violascens]GHI39699.1 single-stranded DNA-binding protein [Streptomyces violascens]